MSVSLEALAMAGADSGSPNYRLTIEEWERKYVTNPAPHLLCPRSSSKRSEKISCKNYPLFLFYFPKKHQKSCDCSEEEEKKRCHGHDSGYSSDYDNDSKDDEDECPRKKKRKKGSMAKGFEEFGVMVKRISCKILNFFKGAIKKKKKKSKSLCN